MQKKSRWCKIELVVHIAIWPFSDILYVYNALFDTINNSNRTFMQICSFPLNVIPSHWYILVSILILFKSIKYNTYSSSIYLYRWYLSTWLLNHVTNWLRTPVRLMCKMEIQIMFCLSFNAPPLCWASISATRCFLSIYIRNILLLSLSVGPKWKSFEFHRQESNRT